jgi:hypothetical protein
MTSKTKKVLKWAGGAILFLGITGAYTGYKMWTKPHRNVAEAKAAVISSAQLAADYETNEQSSNQKYLDKVLLVSGEVDDITKNQLGQTIVVVKGTDMCGVRCTIDDKKIAEVKPGSAVSVKGICTGYLTDVVLVRCVLAK